jgi:outer membrane protein assembly factor BamB
MRCAGVWHSASRPRIKLGLAREASGVKSGRTVSNLINRNIELKQNMKPHVTLATLSRPWIVTWILFFNVAAGRLAAHDWPQWRGPHRDDVSQETGLLKQWPDGGPKLAWEAKGLGGGYSTPSVAQGRVFGSGYLNQKEVVWALDEKTGQRLWATETGSAYKNMGYEDGPRSTPTVDGELLYALGGGGRLVCLTSPQGKLVWKREFREEFGGRMMSGWGFSESVLVDGDNLVCTPGALKGTVLALNKKTGAVVWQSREFKDKAAYASLVPVDYGGVRQYVVLTDASVAGVAAKDGRLLWRVDRPGSTAVIATPIFYEGLVYVTSSYDVGCNLFKVTAADGRFSADQVYANKVMVNHHGGVVRLREYLYGFSDRGNWICQNIKTGQEVWRHKGVGKGSITYADGHLYLRSEGGRGTVALIEASPDGYEEKGRFDQPDRSRKNSWPHPVVANGKLYLRDQDVLLCYDVQAP